MEQKTESVKNEQKGINKDWTIQDIFDKFPGKGQKLAQIMTNAGLHCVGCSASTHETLEQGIMGHGMPQEELTKLVTQLNEAINAETTDEEITLTDAASDKIKALIAADKKEGWGLRIALVAGGCSGFQYELSLNEKALDNEKEYNIKGVKLFITAEHLDKMSGSEVDYVDGLQGAGFKVNNPNVTKSCGCGSSMGF